MKPNELMIGDWVSICGEPKQVKDIDVRRIGIVFSKLIHAVDETMAQSIPLTAEILEKNGWKKEFDKKPYMTFYHLEDEKYWLMWCISEHTLDIQRQNKTLLDQYNLCAERVVIACNYVHQLQHALRLCGIDKEIVL